MYFSCTADGIPFYSRGCRVGLFPERGGFQRAMSTSRARLRPMTTSPTIQSTVAP